MTPKERQENSRGRICKTYFKPGGIKDAKCGTRVPKNMLCSGCVAFTNGKRFSPHNVLFCSSKHPAHNKPQRGELMKVLEKYFGCLIGPEAPMDQIRSGTFTCSQDCEDEEDWRECITTNVRTVGPVETVYLTQ